MQNNRRNNNLNFDIIPESIVKKMLDPRGYEAAFIVGKMVGDKSKLLSVGGGYGRDYYYLSPLGKEVTVFDIAKQSHLPELIKGDITKGTPFADKQFDAVIMGEILEHLIEDKQALTEINRILADDGILVVTVPLYNDKGEFHVRIHSPLSIKRLLAACGFSVEKVIYRGGLISFPGFLKKLRAVLFYLTFSFLSKDKFHKEKFKERFCLCIARFD
ncbi:MAG: methyltransferase domain-containing protein, partial [Planctomycetota bacterium]